MKKEKYFRLNKEETEALAQEYGTPLLVLSLEQIEKKLPPFAHASAAR